MPAEKAREFVVGAEVLDSSSDICSEVRVYSCRLPDFVCDFPDREQEVFLFEDVEDYFLNGFRFQSVCSFRGTNVSGVFQETYAPVARILRRDSSFL